MRKPKDRRVDLIKHSLDHLLALTFVQNRSPSYPLAANIVRGCRLHEEVLAGKHLVHFAVFEKTLEDAGRALAILSYLGASKTLQVFAKGRLIPSVSSVIDVLDCYTKASRCSDRGAHCSKVIGDPFEQRRDIVSARISFSAGSGPIQDEMGEPPIDRYLFPCSFVLRRHVSLQRNHPSNPHDQIQAQGVEAGADLCPFFKPDEFRKIGTEMRVKGKTFLWPDES
jgi:hypothetical protein